MIPVEAQERDQSSSKLKAKLCHLVGRIPALMCTSNAPLKMFNLTSVLIVPTLSNGVFYIPVHGCEILSLCFS